MIDAQVKIQMMPMEAYYSEATDNYLADLNPIQQVAQNLKMDIPSFHDFETTRELAEAIFKKMETGDISRNICVNIAKDNIFRIEASASRYVITLSPLYFLSRNEVPFTGPADPALEDDDKVLEFANYLDSRRTTQLDAPEVKVTWRDRMNLRLYLAATSDTQQTANMVSFIFNHEMGHIENEHFKEKKVYQKEFSSNFYTAINAVTLGLFKRSAMNLLSRRQEREADEYSFTKLERNANGGIHLFDTISSFSPVGLMENLAYRAYCFTISMTHGSFESRSQRIKDYLSGRF